MIARRLAVVLLFAVAVVTFFGVGASRADLPTFTIVVERDAPVGEAQPSRIFVNGKEIGPGLERVATKIAAGEYTGKMRYASSKGFAQGPFGGMAHTGDFLLEVSGVQGRTDILFHGGTRPIHSKGCILLGAVRREDGGGAATADDSTLRKLRLAFYGSEVPTSTPAVDIKVIVRDPASPEAGVACDWNEAVGCADVRTASGTRCGSATSFEVQYSNRCPFAIKVVACTQDRNGKWGCSPDGRFQDGVKPGAKPGNTYSCDGTGGYKVFAMPIDKFAASHCRYPRGSDVNPK